MNGERITARYHVATPMFCSGADPSAAELRLASFKGVLRWWWRALAWSRLGEDGARIRTAEDRLFGSADGGQSRVIMRIAHSTARAVNGADAISHWALGARYLAFGAAVVPGKHDAKPARGALAPFDFTLELVLRARAPALPADERALLDDALRVGGLLGGLGAKSRKGYGSLALVELAIDGAPIWRAPASLDALAAEIAPLLRRAATAKQLPPYTALSAHTRIVLVASPAATSPIELLDRVGREIVRYRSWGRDGRVLGNVAREENFKDDHDLMKRPARTRRSHPQRVGFGLPHPNGNGADQRVRPGDHAIDRRASPLLLHVRSCGDSAVAVLSLIPAVFLPGAAPTIDVGAGQRVPLASPEALRRPIDALLDRFLAPGSRKEPFGRACEVRP
ncbi:MAG TPA: type III-B CRISPR module RAMP protein Cmr1 [Kofleriaceae bacterium]|nr:type III-B CRISPR module RAMP protein Cmr1 [Kofleriaceae bacterium]